MGVREYSVWIKAAPEQVWRVYVDPTRIPEWQTGKPVIGDVQGAPGRARLDVRLEARPPLRADDGADRRDAPHELVTRTDAYLGLQLEVTSRLSGRSDGTDLELRVVTHWRRGLGLVAKVVELAILNPREARKELAHLKTLVEREA